MKKILLFVSFLLIVGSSFAQKPSFEVGWSFKELSDPFEKRYLLYSHNWEDSTYYSLEYIRGEWNFIIKSPNLFYTTKIETLEFSYEDVLILESGDTVKTNKVMGHPGFKKTGPYIIIGPLFGDQLINFKTSDNIYIRFNEDRDLIYKIPNKNRKAILQIFFL
jgi:hypothetical protein